MSWSRSDRWKHTAKVFPLHNFRCEWKLLANSTLIASISCVWVLALRKTEEVVHFHLVLTLSWFKFRLVCLLIRPFVEGVPWVHWLLSGDVDLWKLHVRFVLPELVETTDWSLGHQLVLDSDLDGGLARITVLNLLPKQGFDVKRHRMATLYRLFAEFLEDGVGDCLLLRREH